MKFHSFNGSACEVSFALPEITHYAQRGALVRLMQSSASDYLTSVEWSVGHGLRVTTCVPDVSGDVKADTAALVHRIIDVWTEGERCPVHDRDYEHDCELRAGHTPPHRCGEWAWGGPRSTAERVQPESATTVQP